MLPGEISDELLQSRRDEEGNILPYIEPGLGFHIPGMFDKVLDIDRCHLGSELSDSIRLFVRDYCLSNPEKYPYFDLRNQEGLMRTLMIRTTSIGESMVVVVFYRDDVAAREELLDALRASFALCDKCQSQ